MCYGVEQAEEAKLQQLSTNRKHRGTRTRATSLLVLRYRIKPKVIAKQLGVNGQAVYMWSHVWRGSVVDGHNGGRLRALPNAMIATARDVSRTEPLTLAPIAQRAQVIRNEPLRCRIETFDEALKREDCLFKRNRYGLEKKRNEENFQLKVDTLGKL